MRKHPRYLGASVCLLAGSLLAGGLLRADPSPPPAGAPVLGSAALPDSPGFAPSSSITLQSSVPQTPSVPVQIAPKRQFTIKPGQTAQPLTAADKFGFGTRTAISPFGFVGSITSAGIAHAYDSRPHFGTDSAGFGERLGATVYRSDVKAYFGFGVFPALFHDDPRYYVLGDAAPFKQRVLYAGTRVLIARKDSGARGVNYPRLLAPVISQGSANGFYPSRDRDISKTVTGILTSYAASAGTDELKEFRADILRLLHLKH